MSWHRTDWKFVTSETREITVGPLGVTAGQLFVTSPKSRGNVALTFEARGAGASVGSPAGANMSLPELPGRGFGPIWGNRTRKLTRASFEGFCLVLSGQAVAFPGLFGGAENPALSGASVAVVYMGIHLDPRLRPAPGGPIAPDVYLESRAVGVIWGLTLSLIPVSAGVMGYVGYISA